MPQAMKSYAEVQRDAKLLGHTQRVSRHLEEAIFYAGLGEPEAAMLAFEQAQTALDRGRAFLEASLEED
ncbi:hypothetical protein [Halorarum salinum]|uniref:hypothetical protein n=1 Tax=Halorarum salinum TaxID=2743089 RepID=UPI001C533F78|nr:hypothetical protein [Halobaculum salinum]